MSRAEKIARRWFTACGVTLVPLYAALCAVAQTPWALIGVVPFACLLIGCMSLDDPPRAARLYTLDEVAAELGVDLSEDGSR